MTEMEQAGAIINIPDYKVAEMERKGWKVVGKEPTIEIQDDSEEELKDGDSYGF